VKRLFADLTLGLGVVFSDAFLNEVVELMIRGIHEHDILKIVFEVKPCVIGSLELRPIHIPFDPVGNGAGESFHKDMNELILINALCNLLVNVQSKGADDIVFDIGPAIGQEPEPLQLRLFDQVAMPFGVLVEEDELLAFFLDLLFGDGFHVLQLLLCQNDESNRLDGLVPHPDVAWLPVVLDLYLLVEVFF
jgi:hypothetical protein